jgi:hypothetical protein
MTIDISQSLEFGIMSAQRYGCEAEVASYCEAIPGPARDALLRLAVGGPVRLVINRKKFNGRVQATDASANSSPAEATGQKRKVPIEQIEPAAKRPKLEITPESSSVATANEQVTIIRDGEGGSEHDVGNGGHIDTDSERSISTSAGNGGRTYTGRSRSRAALTPPKQSACFSRRITRSQANKATQAQTGTSVPEMSKESESQAPTVSSRWSKLPTRNKVTKAKPKTKVKPQPKSKPKSTIAKQTVSQAPQSDDKLDEEVESLLTNGKKDVVRRIAENLVEELSGESLADVLGELGLVHILGGKKTIPARSEPSQEQQEDREATSTNGGGPPPSSINAPAAMAFQAIDLRPAQMAIQDRPQSQSQPQPQPQPQPQQQEANGGKIVIIIGSEFDCQYGAPNAPQKPHTCHCQPVTTQGLSVVQAPAVVQPAAVVHAPALVQTAAGAQKAPSIKQQAVVDTSAAVQQSATIPLAVQEAPLVQTAVIVRNPPVIQQPAVVPKPPTVQTPAAAQTSTVIQKPAVQKPALAQTPSVVQRPTVTRKPDMVQTSAVIQGPAVQKPASANTPSAAQTPATVRKPTVSQQPVIVQAPAPAAAQTSAPVQKPAVQKPALAQITPVAQRAPAFKQTISAKQPVTVQKPAAIHMAAIAKRPTSTSTSTSTAPVTQPAALVRTERQQQGHDGNDDCLVVYSRPAKRSYERQEHAKGPPPPAIQLRAPAPAQTQAQTQARPISGSVSQRQPVSQNQSQGRSQTTAPAVSRQAQSTSGQRGPLSFPTLQTGPSWATRVPSVPTTTVPVAVVRQGPPAPAQALVQAIPVQSSTQQRQAFPSTTGNGGIPTHGLPPIYTVNKGSGSLLYTAPPQPMRPQPIPTLQDHERQMQKPIGLQNLAAAALWTQEQRKQQGQKQQLQKQVQTTSSNTTTCANIGTGTGSSTGSNSVSMASSGTQTIISSPAKVVLPSFEELTASASHNNL